MRPRNMLSGIALIAIGAAIVVPQRARAQDAEVDAEAQQNVQQNPRRNRRQNLLKPIARPAERRITPQNQHTPGALVAPSTPAPGPRASIVPQKGSTNSTMPAQTQVGSAAEVPRYDEPPSAGTPADHKTISKNARRVLMNFDKRDLSDVVQFVSDFTQRNFILPERVGGKITILSREPIGPDEVWNVFLAALDANNWAVYPVGSYWKLSEKKQSTRANIPLYLDSDQRPPATEQMVTKLFKLKYVEADQMRNTLNQFTSRDSDFQIFPPDTMIISELGLNMRRLEKLIEELDRPGGSEEVRIVQVQYAAAQELAQKLTEIFQAQAGGKGGGAHRALGVGAPIQPAPQQPGVVPQPSVPGSPDASGGSVSVSKIIAEDRTNKLIVIANPKSFERVLRLIKQLDVPAGGGGVHVYYLDNAKAEEIAATLQALAQGVSSSSRRRTGTGTPGAPGFTPPTPAGGTGAAGPGGAGTADLFSGEVKITADKNTNSLVIIASPADYRNLVKVIQQLDVRRRQVFVEAVIMEVNLQDNTDLGLSAHGGTVLNNVNFRGAQGDAPVVFGSELGNLNSIGGVAGLASLGGFLAGVQGPPVTVPGINLSLPSFGLVLNALQSSSDVNVISTPHVIMADNSEGEITVGQNVPFQAGYAPQLGGLTSALSGVTGASGSTTGALGGLGLGLGGLGSLYAPIQRQNVELRLRIKPQISESDFVRLEIDEQTEEIASVDKTLGPTTSKRTAKTTIMAKDQETVVIGGLVQERTTKSVQKVPLLGSIPVIGWLFRNQSDQKQKTNLLLFLTPYIIRDQSDFRRILERKMAERAEFVKRFYGDDANYVHTIDYERKLGPLQRVRSTINLELSKAENGGTGAPGEKVIGPAQRPPPQLDESTARPIPTESLAPPPAHKPIVIDEGSDGSGSDKSAPPAEQAPDKEQPQQAPEQKPEGNQ